MMISLVVSTGRYQIVVLVQLLLARAKFSPWFNATLSTTHAGVLFWWGTLRTLFIRSQVRGSI
jgi:hypothetical protein